MVRRAEERDLPRIAEIIIFGKRVAYRPIFQNDEVSFRELTVVGLYNELVKTPEIWKNMLVYDDGLIKGVVRWDATDAEDTAELTNFYVEPLMKGQGIGREILTQLVEELRPEYEKIMCWVIKENLPARRFYEANGFKATGREQIIEGTEKIDMQYIKIL